VVAAAQSASNVAVAKANTVLQNIDEDHPDGSVRYVVTGSYSYVEPRFDADGNIVGETTHDIPLRKRVVALTAKNQLIKDAQDDVKLKFATLAETQTDSIAEKLALPFSLSGLPNRGVVPYAPAIDTSTPTRGVVINSIGSNNFNLDRAAAETAIKERLEWQINRDRSARTLKLELMGIFPGSEAYEYELLVFDRASNDARIQAFLLSSQEMATRQKIDIDRADFANRAQMQVFQQGALVIEIKNKSVLQHFQSLITMATYVDDQRQKALQIGRAHV
jgi:hypothetical protein